nr:putative ribonuclease H-like domain-containing protein [Tanacetum cinerariifolium]
MEAPHSPDYIPGPDSPDYIPGLEYPEYLLPADDVFPVEEQPLLAAISPTTESPVYITNSNLEMDPDEEDGDDEKSKGDSINYPTSRGNDDAHDNGDDLSEDDVDDEDEEESSDSEEEEEEHLALIVPAPALHSFISASEDSDQTEPFEEGETTATPPPSAYRVTARISIRPHIPMPFSSKSEVSPKVSHLHAVKRIFRYLKGQPKLGIWYPKDSPIELEAYTNSDYAGSSLDKKSTIDRCQFLGCRLISWQCKKHIVVANSTTEAEYVAASSCCG